LNPPETISVRICDLINGDIFMWDGRFYIFTSIGDEIFFQRAGERNGKMGTLEKMEFGKKSKWKVEKIAK
jgi:hypothetical protein